MVPFFLSLWKLKEILLRNLPSELGWAPRNNILQCCVDSPEVFNSRAWPHWASDNLSIAVQVFLPWHWFPQSCALVSLCSSKQRLPVFAGLSLQSWSRWFALHPLISYESKKSCGFFSLLSFLLVRVEWRLPSSLHVEQETGSLHTFYYFIMF